MNTLTEESIKARIVRFRPRMVTPFLLPMTGKQLAEEIERWEREEAGTWPK